MVWKKASIGPEIDLRPTVVINAFSTLEPFTGRTVKRTCRTYPYEQDEDTEPLDEEEDETDADPDEDEDDVVEKARRALRDYGCSVWTSEVSYEDPDDHMDPASGDITRCQCLLNGFSIKELGFIQNAMER
jgi:hypothetical protein